MKIVSVEQMRALEAAAFASGVQEADLQEHAGRAVAEEVARLVQPGEHVSVMVGHGNNGRDGAVAARWLAQRRIVTDVVLAPRHAVTETELQHLERLGVRCIASGQATELDRALTNAAVVVDGLAGIGIRGALREPLASLARQVNQCAASVVAIDVPSGANADTGEAPPDTVRADVTVTLGAVKQGLLRFPAADHVGRLMMRDIGLPADAGAHIPFDVLDTGMLRECVPERPLDAHKYRFGRVLVVAGSDHFLGAPVLCAGGALRVGAGLVTVGSTRDVRLNVATHVPEATFTTDDVAPRHDPDAALAALAPYLSSHTLVVGPGLGRGPSLTTFVGELLRTRSREHGLVIDADGLFALSEIEHWPALVDANVVLTPHSGELARLAGREVGDWQDAASFADQWQCVVIAKGPFTAVASPNGRTCVWPHANPALATGGTGDVLAGICSGLLAQGMDAFAAARLAVGVHALVAERVIARRGSRTLLASDLHGEIPAVLAHLATSR